MSMLPFVPILIALRRDLAIAFDGVMSSNRPVGVRHHRHRETTSSERPCLAIRFVSDDVSSAIGRDNTDDGMPEQVNELVVDLSLDLDLDPESTDFADETGDPTGYGEHARLLAIALDRLLPGDLGDDNTLGGLVWQIRCEGTPSNEGDAEPDEARLEERLVLLYRVRSDQPTILLTE